MINELAQAALELMPTLCPDAPVDAAAKLCELHAAAVLRRVAGVDNTSDAAAYAVACYAAASLAATGDAPTTMRAGDVSVTAGTAAERAVLLRREGDRALEALVPAAVLTVV